MKESGVRNRTIARRLREARSREGLSQSQAARMMGMHRPTISEIEAGNRKVSAEELQHFARVYDVSIEWLLGQDANKPASHATRVQRAYRELRKLEPDDIDRLLNIVAIMRGRAKRVRRSSRSIGGNREAQRRSTAESRHIEWTPHDNARRCELIDREIEGSITFDEAEELEKLQQAMRNYLDRVAPLPLEGAKRLHAALLRKYRSRR